MAPPKADRSLQPQEPQGSSLIDLGDDKIENEGVVNEPAQGSSLIDDEIRLLIEVDNK